MVAETKSNQFFGRLLAYGGISTEPGIIYMWGDPDILIPAKAFVNLQKNLNKYLKTEGEDLLIWGGMISGYQSSEVLGKKFGIPFEKIWGDNHEDLDNLINGATQDGFGFIKATSYPKKIGKIDFSLDGQNCTIGKLNLELNKKSKSGKDWFVKGIMLGGAQFIYKKDLSIIEEKCIAKGDKNCLFRISEGKQTKKLLNLFKKVNIDQKEIEQKINGLYLKRPQKGTFLNAKKIQFGDGKFIFMNKEGIVIASRVMACCLEYLKKRLNKKKYLLLLDEFTKGYKEEIFKSLTFNKIKTNKDVFKLIESLNNFGLGQFKLATSSKNILFLENKNNPIAQDRKFIFGLSKENEDEMIIQLLKNTFEKFYEKEVEVIESECISRGKSRCLFKISF